MHYTPPGKHRQLAAFREHWRAVAPDLGLDEGLEGAAGPLGQPREVAGRVAGNRFCIHPMEGWDGTRAGLPSEHTLRRWRRFGESGAKLVWGGEAFAVRADGRANPNQLFLNPAVDTEGGLAALLAATEEAHAEHGATDDLVVGLQLTHSGRFARPDGSPAPVLVSHHPVLDARLGVDAAPLVSDNELEAIGAAFVRAAELAARVGFDFVDVKCCHGYLLHELLGARARPGPYGGSFEHRTRLFREIVAGIRAACPGLEIALRVSLGDVFPHSADPATGVGAPLGWERHLPFEHQLGVDRADPREPDFAEPLRFLAHARDIGIRLVNVTLGSPYYCPHLQRPAAYPPSDGYLPPRDPLAEVAVHLRAVRAARAAFPELTLVGTGYSYLAEWLPHVAQHEVRHGHADFVGLGRMVLAYPELPRDVLAGRPLDKKRFCRTFSDCTTAPRNGLISGCYPLDPHYKRLPEAQRLAALKRSPS